MNIKRENILGMKAAQSYCNHKYTAYKEYKSY